MSKKPRKTGKDAVRKAIEGASPATPTPPAFAGLPDFLAAKFGMTATGLWRKSGDDGSDIWVAAPFEVLAETRDERGEDRGLWLAWHDREAAGTRWRCPRPR